jgi:teichuronic acid biosynthesis glycosyltransferase TuaH
VGVDRPVVLATRGLHELAGTLEEAFSIFLMLDWFQTGEGPALIGLDPRVVAAVDAANCDAADLICVVSPALQRSLAERGWDSVVVRHGFHVDMAPLYDSAPIPPEYARLPRPILGYTGSIDGRLDFQALAALADRFDRGSLVLVGPISPRLDRAKELDPLLARPNTHLISFRAREQRPAYLRHLDCGLLPYRRTTFAEHGAPLKFWEYLYAGAPLVGMGYTDLLNFPPPLAHFAEGPARFPDVVAQVLAAGPEQGRDERRAFALANSWEARANELEALIEERTSRRL